MMATIAHPGASPPEPLRGKVRAFAETTELGPHHALLDELRAGERAEAAVDAREDARPVAHRLRGCDDPVGDDLGVLDDVGRGVYDAGQEQHPVGERIAAERPELVLVPRAGE